MVTSAACCILSVHKGVALNRKYNGISYCLETAYFKEVVISIIKLRFCVTLLSKRILKDDVGKRQR